MARRPALASLGGGPSMGEQLAAGNKRPRRHAPLAGLTRESRPWVRRVGSVAAACVLIRRGDGAAIDGRGDEGPPGEGHQSRGDTSVPQFLTDVGGTLFFGADDGTNGIELWKSDGTAAGTVLVKDINPGATARAPVPDERERDAVLRGRRRHPRRRAVEERRHGGRHRAGQGHQPRRRQAPTPGYLTNVERHAVLRGRRRHQRDGAVEERRHRGRHGPGQGHQPRHGSSSIPAT